MSTWLSRWRRALEKKDWILIDEMIDNVDAQLSAQRNLALRLACEKGQTDIVKRLLLSKQVDPSAKHNHALCAAAVNGHKDIVQLLLQTNRVNATARRHFSIVMAIARKHFDIADMLFALPVYKNMSIKILCNCILRRNDAIDSYPGWAFASKQIQSYLDRKGIFAVYFQQESLRFDEIVRLSQPFYFYNWYSRYMQYKAYEFRVTKDLLILKAKTRKYLVAEYEDCSKYIFGHKPLLLLETPHFFSLLIVIWHGLIKNPAYVIGPNRLRYIIDIDRFKRIEYTVCGFIRKKVAMRQLEKKKQQVLAGTIDQAMYIACGLQQIKLPTLLLVELFYSTCQPFANCFDFHLAWSAIDCFRLK